MKLRCWIGGWLLVLWMPAVSWAASDALIKLPNFDSLADKASDSVNITLDEPVLKMATRFLSADDPTDAAAVKILQGLRGIYVRSYTFRDEFSYPREQIEALRKQVTAPGWNPLMEVKSTKEKANVGIYISLDGANRANGLVIISTEPREFTVVNIVGSIDLDQLKSIEGKFGIPRLDIESRKPTKK